MPDRTQSIGFNLVARDVSVSKTLARIEKRSQNFARTLRGLVGLFGVAFSARAIVGWADDSLQAYADAQKAQLKLEDAYSRFPALADVNINALRKLNQARALTTRFDDDATAAAQAQLAQYGLTGQQILKLTPLVQDFAAKTGRDLVDASEAIGKALLGSGRALKEVGIDFVDTGSVAGNFDEIMAGLSAQVGGFAEKEGTTAAGKLEILRNRFGEVQEKVGEALQPALSDLIDFTNDTVLPGLEDFSDWFSETGMPKIRDFIGWIQQYKDILGPAAAAIGGLTTAQWLLNIAMDANPVGLVILGITLLIALIAALMTNFGGITSSLFAFYGGIWQAAIGIQTAVAGVFDALVNGAIDAINRMLGPINALRGLAGLPPLVIPHANSAATFAKFGNSFQAGGILLQMQMNGTAMTSTKTNTTSGGRNGINAGLAGGGGTNAIRQGSFADGGVVSAATLALIGEGSESEVVAPLSKLPAILQGAGLAGNGGSDGMVLELHGDAAALDGVFSLWLRKADGTRVQQSKMGKQK